MILETYFRNAKTKQREREKQRKEAAKRMNWLMPCYHFANAGDADIEKQVRKTYDEMREVEAALREEKTHENRIAALMEIADVQICLETLMKQMGADEEERNAVRAIVWSKNNRRKYYDKK